MLHRDVKPSNVLVGDDGRVRAKDAMEIVRDLRDRLEGSGVEIETVWGRGYKLSVLEAGPAT